MILDFQVDAEGCAACGSPCVLVTPGGRVCACSSRMKQAWWRFLIRTGLARLVLVVEVSA